MADKNIRVDAGSDEKHLPRHEDIGEENFGRVAFKRVPFLRHMLDKHPIVEETYMSLVRSRQE